MCGVYVYCIPCSKNFGGQKVWQKGLLQGIGEKKLVNEVCVVAMCFSIRNKHRATF